MPCRRRAAFRRRLLPCCYAIFADADDAVGMLPALMLRFSPLPMFSPHTPTRYAACHAAADDAFC